MNKELQVTLNSFMKAYDKVNRISDARMFKNKKKELEG